MTNNPSPNVLGPQSPGCGMIKGATSLGNSEVPRRKGPTSLGNQCDQYFSNRCAHFQDLMHGLKSPMSQCASCFGNPDHREYICPEVGPRCTSGSPNEVGLGNPALGSPNTPCGRDCFNQPPNNLGANRVCYSDSLPGQSSLPSFNGFAAYRQTGGAAVQPMKSVQRRAEQGLAKGSSGSQRGGAFSAFPSALDVDINDPVYNRCETVVHLTPSYLEGPVYGNLADTCNLRTNFRPSKQPGLDVSTVRAPGLQVGPIMQTSLCGDRQRCGNGACAPTQTSSLDSCITGCKKINLPRSCLWDDRVLTSPWVYGRSTADIPTFYYDLSGETVGARPQFRAGTNNSIPPMMLINQTNLLGKQFGCRQPCWQTNCL